MKYAKRSITPSALLLCFSLLLLWAASINAQQTTQGAGGQAAQQTAAQSVQPAQERKAQLDESLLSKLPPPLRAHGLALLNERNVTKRVGLADRFTQHGYAETIEFLLGLCEADPAPEVRRALISRLSARKDPRLLRMLQNRATADPDVETAMLALVRWRMFQTRELR